MGKPIDRLTIHGFKSIERLDDFPLGPLNVLIGANGAGKSNFVSVFRVIRAISSGRLQSFVEAEGGSDGFFCHGVKITKEIRLRSSFGHFQYEIRLKPLPRSTLGLEEVISSENQSVMHSFGPDSVFAAVGRSTQMVDPKLRHTELQTLQDTIGTAVADWIVYHFHDTGPTSGMRRDHELRDDERLSHDAANVATFLHRLRETNPGSYELIRDTIRLVAPFFDDFLLRPRQVGPAEMICLEWRQKGSDFPFQPYQLSDGTIRFICLATALLQPDPPSTIIIDEPELGLHPHALAILAGLVKSAATRTQVILSTQSPTLLDHFEPEQIIVVNRREGRSEFERLDSQALASWLEDYSVGELWEKNVVRGGPASD